MRMTDLLLSLSNISKVVYPWFYKVQKLLQIQLIQSHVRDLSDLKEMDERGAAKMLGHMEGRIVCAAIKVRKFMCIERRERFMQDLGLIWRTFQPSWYMILLTPMTLQKRSLTGVQNSKDSSTCVRDKYLVCDGSCGDFSHGQWLGLASSGPWNRFELEGDLFPELLVCLVVYWKSSKK